MFNAVTLNVCLTREELKVSTFTLLRFVEMESAESVTLLNPSPLTLYSIGYVLAKGVEDPSGKVKGKKEEEKN